MGLTVFGTAGTPAGLELALREGASLAFDHGREDHAEKILEATGGRGVDIILEMLANVNLAGDAKMLARDGRVIVIGSRGPAALDARDLMVRRGSVRAFTLWDITPAEEKEINAGVGAGLANGTLRPVVGREYPLGEAARAHKEVMEPGASGKIVLIPPYPAPGDAR